MTRSINRNKHTYQEIYEVLRESSKPKLDFYVLIAIASVIATFGLLLNSTATIIGAMIVSPLMDPILGVSFASLIRKRRFTAHSAWILTSGIGLTILLSYLIGLLFSSVGITDEMLSRTKPNIMDMLVALAAGFLGAYVKVRTSISGTVYGAAIAIALTPPLCVIGLGFALREQAIYAGASLLFLTNLVSILLSSLLAFMWIDIPRSRIALKSFIIPVLAVIALAIPLALSFNTLIEERKLSQELQVVLQSGTHTFENLDIAKIEMDLFQKPVQLTVTVRAMPDQVTPKQVKLVQEYLEKRTGHAIQLTVNVTPIREITGDSFRAMEPEVKETTQ